MIRVERKRFRDYLLKREQQLIAQTDVSVFDSRRYLAAPFVAALALAVGLGLLAFQSRTALVLFITELMSLAVLFFHTKVIADRMTVSRVLPPRSLREMDSAEVIIEIRNRSDFEVSNLLVDDVFGLTKNPMIRLAPESLRPRAMIRIPYKRICDGGMGTQKVGPLTVRITDVLGIFEFRVIEDTVHELEVYPKVDRVPPLHVLPSLDSARYGNYEVASRGLSVNFSGVRPYERGDSLRHIAWKLSTRGQGLLVKEFEKVVNCEVSIVLNMAPQWQVGRHSASTWEYGKDVTLSIIQQQLDLGNTVAFFSDQSFVQAGAGSDHFHYLARHVAGLKLPLEDDGLELEPKPVLGIYRDFYPRGSNLFYVTPFNLAEFRTSEPWLRRLKAEGFHVTCVLIDTNSFWLQFIESISTGLLIGAKLMQGIEEVANNLEMVGIKTYVVSNKVRLQDALV